MAVGPNTTVPTGWMELLADERTSFTLGQFTDDKSHADDTPQQPDDPKGADEADVNNTGLGVRVDPKED